MFLAISNSIVVQANLFSDRIEKLIFVYCNFTNVGRLLGQNNNFVTKTNDGICDNSRDA
jgi:hypothetical protein